VTRLRLGPVLLPLTLLALPLAAQDEWRASYYPYLVSAANEFPLIGARYELRRDADWEARWLSDGVVSAAAAAGFQGSRFATVEFKAPGLEDGWRLFARASAVREARLGFYGFGNSSEIDEDLEESAVNYYRVKRYQYLGRVEVTRRIRGPLQVAWGGGVVNTKFADLPAPTLFGTTIGLEDEDTDLTGRISLIYDTRDREYNPATGTLLEIGALAGSGGDGYGRYYGEARGFVTPRFGTVVAGRLAAVTTVGDPPLNAFYDLETWEGGRTGYGGRQTNRGLPDGRRIDADQLYASLEVRQTLLDVGDFGSVSLMLFADAGRVFEEGALSLTAEDLAVGGGGGIILRALKGGILTFNFAGGPEGFQFTSTTGWAF
jgi:outer membrane protein assembly factor BamA